MTPVDRSLELTGPEFRSLTAVVVDRLATFLDSLDSLPAADTVDSATLARSLVEPLPRNGRPVDEVLDQLFARIIAKGLNTAGPGYLAYIPGGGLPESAVAELIAATTNRYVGVFAAAPGLVQIESNVVRWLCDIVGYPADALGILTSGGSLATFSAVVTARRDRLPEDFLAGTIYVSDQVHHSLYKATMLAGFPTARVRVIPTDARFRIRIDRLQRTIAEDRASGLLPFLLIGNAGTTNTGAVDDLQALADLATAERLWFHVDAAYGGFFLLTDRGRQVMRGIERADSIVLDPHKGLFLPYGTGSLVVRDGTTLRRAHELTGEYMPVMQEEADLVDFNLLSPELSRAWRGLRVWLPLQLHGIEPFRSNLDEKLDLTDWATQQLERIADIQIVAAPQLSIVAFRLVRPGLNDEALDSLNRRLLERINARQRVHVTGTRLAGRFVIRICVLSFRTHRDRMEQGLDDIRAAVDEMVAES